MTRFLVPALVLLAGLAVLLLLRRPPLIRGLAEDMLVSPNRPAVAFRAAPGFRLTDAARADPLVSIRHVNVKTSVRLWYALYARDDDRHPARLAAVFAEADEPYYWPPEPATPAVRLIRQRPFARDGFDGTAQTLILPPAQDPWHDETEIAPWTDGCLVRRLIIPAFFLRFAILVDYREPLPPAGGTPIADDLPALAAFEQRADAAFALVRPQEGSALPRPEKTLSYPPKSVRRTLLGELLGEVRAEDAR